MDHGLAIAMVPMRMNDRTIGYLAVGRKKR
jgi:hypothetical protein